jgi:hypothetical protein
MWSLDLCAAYWKIDSEGTGLYLNTFWTLSFMAPLKTTVHFTREGTQVVFNGHSSLVLPAGVPSDVKRSSCGNWNSARRWAMIDYFCNSECWVEKTRVRFRVPRFKQRTTAREKPLSNVASVDLQLAGIGSESSISVLPNCTPYGSPIHMSRNQRRTPLCPR